MKHLEKELEKSVGEIIIDLQRKNRDLERELENIRDLSRQHGKAFDECLKDYRGLVKDYMKQEEENKKLREEVEQLKNQRIFNSTEYDLITLTSTTPQWELRRK